MRCKTCQYLLWNLRARECPECGTPFLPSEYEFVPNAVRFCCPHCGQDYYGTDQKGHLVPPSFQCISCGRAITMNQCVLLPTEGVHEDKAVAETFPWTERRRIGLLKAWLLTVGRSLVAPSRLASAIPPNGPLGVAYAAGNFALISALCVGVIMLVVLFGALAGGGGGMLAAVGAIAGSALIPPVALLAYLGAWVFSAHFIVATANPARPSFRRTCQALAFSAGTLLPACVPCLGVYILGVSAVWWVVSAGIMLRRIHGITPLRAAFAVAALPVLLLFVGGIAVLSLFYTIPPSIAPPPAPWTGPPSTGMTAPLPAAERMASALGGFRGLHKRWPIHPYEIVQDALIDSEGFRPLSSASDLTVRQFDKPVAVTRYGDFVFCYYGLPTDPAPEHWLFIVAPDPDVTPDAAPPNQPIVVGKAGGQVVTMTPEGFAQALDGENARRAALNLPPIPTPDSVRADRPVYMPE